MKIFRLLSMLFAVGTIAASCRITEKIDPDLDIPGLGGYEYPETELDYWLKEKFLDEYNIEVIYRWDAVKMYNGITKKLVPVEADKVQPMMQTIARIWFQPYLEVSDYGFLQKYTPKTVVLAGSPEYSTDGSGVTLGTAEGAVKIFLTNANAFSSTNRAVLKSYMHVIEHEFVHVLNQNVNYNPSFEQISQGTYDPSGWMDYSRDNYEAYARGFLSNYSMVSADEDYAEVISLLLVNGENWFENIVLPIAEKSEVDLYAADKLRSKVAHVENYLDTEFGIRLFDDPVSGEKGFITHVQEAIDYVIEEALINEL